MLMILIFGLLVAQDLVTACFGIRNSDVEIQYDFPVYVQIQITLALIGPYFTWA